MMGEPKLTRRDPADSSAALFLRLLLVDFEADFFKTEAPCFFLLELALPALAVLIADLEMDALTSPSSVS